MDAPKPAPEPYPQIGAWSFFWSAVRDPSATVAVCRRAGVDFLDVMLNDGSRDHLEPVAFHLGRRNALGDHAALEHACEVWRRARLRFGFTTWITPRVEWVEGMAEVGAIAARCGAESVTLDAEEPWLVPLRRSSTEEVRAIADRATGHLRRTCGARIGVTHIVYAERRLIDPLLDFADEDVPQCYATKRNAARLDPGDLERATVKRWARKGDAQLPVIMGAAGWSQEGAYGLGYLPAWRASLKAGREVGAAGVRIWRLDAIDQAEAAVLRDVWGQS